VIAEELGEPTDAGYQEIGNDELRKLIRTRPALPLLRDGEYVRFSLAGSVSKWALVFDRGRFFWPKGRAVSTHILKV
jgi:hypothetical protein